MAKKHSAILRSSRPTPPYWSVSFEIATPPAPGTFLLADLQAPLRTPLFPASIDAHGFSVMVPPGHPATRILPGTEIDMLGPQGHGFHIDKAQRLLLIAEAASLPPLLPLLRAAPSVTLAIEAPTRAQLPSLQNIPPEVELVLITCDGSAGYLGPLECTTAAPDGLQRVAPQLCELITWADKVCCACVTERYSGLAALVRQARIQPAAGFAQALVNVNMPCGYGACEVCRVQTRHGEKKACVDGPVFDLLNLAVEDHA